MAEAQQHDRQSALAALQALQASLRDLAFNDAPLPLLDYKEVVHNMHDHFHATKGGQALVYLCHWHNFTDAPPVIEEGRAVAVKHCKLPHGGGQFVKIETLEQFQKADRFGREALQIELNMLGLLHRKGCGARVVQPLAMVRWPGRWDPDPEARATKWLEPTHAYIMPACRLGSVSSLLDDICSRRVPESVGQDFLSMRFIAEEAATMLGELRKIHAAPFRLMVQDLTAKNLLVDDSEPGGRLRLMLADPAMAQSFALLEDTSRRGARLLGTWLWMPCKVHAGLFDPKADLYSLSFVLAEMWVVAEGAGMSVLQLMDVLEMDASFMQAKQFVRHLICQMLRIHHFDGAIVPRTKRHLPVSWLGAWALLLGFRDYQSESEVLMGLPCLRPGEEEMLDLYQLWARVAAAAEALPSDATLEQVQSDHGPLVADMCAMLRRLLELSHLDDERQRDAPLDWMAANFMEQRHPLVAAMRAQGAAGVGEPEPYVLVSSIWTRAVKWAQVAVGPPSPSWEPARQSQPQPPASPPPAQRPADGQQGEASVPAVASLMQLNRAMQAGADRGGSPLKRKNGEVQPAGAAAAQVQAIAALLRAQPAQQQQPEAHSAPGRRQAAALGAALPGATSAALHPLQLQQGLPPTHAPAHPPLAAPTAGHGHAAWQAAASPPAATGHAQPCWQAATSPLAAAWPTALTAATHPATHFQTAPTAAPQSPPKRQRLGHGSVPAAGLASLVGMPPAGSWAAPSPQHCLPSPPLPPGAAAGSPVRARKPLTDSEEALVRAYADKLQELSDPLSPERLAREIDSRERQLAFLEWMGGTAAAAPALLSETTMLQGSQAKGRYSKAVVEGCGQAFCADRQGGDRQRCLVRLAAAMALRRMQGS